MFVLAFTNDLLMEIGKVQKVRFKRIPRAWDNLLFDLKRDAYDAMLSSMDPTFINLQSYNFSDLYLETGPVLVTSKNRSHFTLDKIKNGFIGVMAGTKSAFYVETHPNLMPKYFGNSGKLCTAVQANQIDGALIPNVVAISFIKDLYSQILQIDTKPMLNEGIRMVKLKTTSSPILEDFDEGLKKIKKNGTYKKLLQKWNLG